jgi:di/tricarboxylate transporter
MVVFSCALALPIGFASGIKAWETGTICLLGTQAGSYFPFSQHGSTARTIIEGMNDGVWAEQAMAINWKIAFIAVVVYIIIIGAFYFVFKNYQLSKVEGVYKPEPFTSVQKKSLVMIALALSLMIIPPAILKFVSIPALKTIVGYCDVTPICLLGAVINLLLGLGNESKVLKKRVPWNVLAMIFGMAMLVNLASKLGVLDYLSAIAQNIPVAAVAPVFLLAAGFISLFSSTLSVVYPTLLPIAGIVAMNTGINPLLAFSVIVIGSATTAISPLSVGGGQVLSCCTEEICDGQTMFTKQFIMALVSMAILTALSIVGSILMV